VCSIFELEADGVTGLRRECSCGQVETIPLSCPSPECATPCSADNAEIRAFRSARQDDQKVPSPTRVDAGAFDMGHVLDVALTWRAAS
jgi:hypothetical protein